MGLEALLSLSFYVGAIALTLKLLPMILIASMGELIAEKSGVLNLGVEGLMLMGAFTAFIATYFTENPWMGILAAVAVTALLGLIFAFLTITLGVNQVVVGLGMWLLGYGLSDVLFRTFITSMKLAVIPTIPAIRDIKIPYLSDIPVIGPIIFSQNPLVYVALATVPLTALFLNRTHIGLRIKAVGENPKAADTMGINVHRMRYLAALIGAAAAGISGAYLSVAYLATFQFGYTAGRGFVALAMIYFGNWSPYRTLLPAFLFNLVDALQIGIISIDPFLSRRYYFFNMLPYLFVVALIPYFGRKVRAPRFLGLPYKK